MMWILLLTLSWPSATQANSFRLSARTKEEATYSPGIMKQTSFVIRKPTASLNLCTNVLDECHHEVHWTRCYEKRIVSCVRGRFLTPNFIHKMVNSSEWANERPTDMHRIQIPSSALQRCRGDDLQQEVVLVATVINSTYFKLSPPQRKGRRTALIPSEAAQMQGSVLNSLVLAVKAGLQPVRNLSEPIKLIFSHNRRLRNGVCVFWQEMEDGTGHWSTDGCYTNNTGAEFICSCNHLSFFAVLVNPELSVDETNARNLSYITYVGSGLSVFFTVICLIIYICLQRRRPEKAIGVHIQLTGALLCLHLSFLLGSFWVWKLQETEEDWVCRFLGLFLHWSLLATFWWTALEGFHLYLLLVRVFNIYIRRYLLKLSLVGWGLPTLVAMACGISGVYGKYNLTPEICWMSSQFPHRLVVSYITTVAFPCLVILCNSCMLGLVLFKLWKVRRGNEDIDSRRGWKKVSKANRRRLWKDCATVLGLSCVLGLPWWLASTTYMSLPGIYVFTVLNSLQGVFMFLWSVALTCKSQSDNGSSVKVQTMTTSFNN